MSGHNYVMTHSHTATVSVLVLCVCKAPVQGLFVAAEIKGGGRDWQSGAEMLVLQHDSEGFCHDGKYEV